MKQLLAVKLKVCRDRSTHVGTARTTKENLVKILVISRALKKAKAESGVKYMVFPDGTIARYSKSEWEDYMNGR